jgi:transposase InsO family protein
MLRDMLAQQGLEVGRRHVRTLMRRMAIETLYRRPNTSKPAPGHRIYPYLLRGVAITRPNQVWSTDITYIPMARGFVYLVAVVDWFSRRVLSWRVSITMDVSFCIEALEEALSKYGKPEIFNTDQGSQFTSEAFTGGSRKKGSTSAWMARAGGATTSSWSASGVRSSTSTSICTPTSRWQKPGARSAATWSSTTAAAPLCAWEH